MKNPFFHIALFLFLPLLIKAQTLLYPKITTDEVTDLVFLNETEGILINKAGTIMKTTDGGFNWKIVKHYQGTELKEIKFLDSNTGFVLYYNGINYTTDRGETWASHDIYLTDANTFMPVTKSVLLKATNRGKIMRLDNFYNTWEEVYSAPTFIIPPEDGFNSRIEPYGYINKFIKFPGGRILAFGTSEFAKARYIIKDSINYILKSDDTGKTWDTLWVGLKEAISASTFSDEKNGWMANGKDLYKTTDGGINWDIINLGQLGSNVYKVFALDNQNIWGITGSSSITGKQFFSSTDSGNNWTISTINENASNQILFINKSDGFLYGYKLLRTSDGGKNWIAIDNAVDANIYSLSFVSLQNGFAVSGFLGNNSLYKTSDGGKTWNKSFTQEVEARQVKMINGSVGWLVARTKVYKTVNGGVTWEEPISLKGKYFFEGITCLGDKHAILYNVKPDSSETYYNLITNNGGQSWEKLPLNNFTYPDLPYNFQYLDKNHLYAMNRKGLWLTEDTTKTWKKLYDLTNSYPECFSFYDKNIGVVFPDYWTISMTSDGGKTWKNYDKVQGNRAYDCKLFGGNFNGEYDLFSVGENGEIQFYILYKDSGPFHKRSLRSFTRMPLYVIDLVVEKTVNFVMMGGHGFNLLTYDAGASFVGIDSEQEVATEYNLYQNYPNPFNASTNIKYSLPASGYVSIKIYDVLGREVAVLANEEKKPGIYEVSLNASHLSSGLYLYKMQSGNYTETKKLILMK
ncbi:MAG: YCF48-related protein [Melioribacteraceae bacterium]